MDNEYHKINQSVKRCYIKNIYYILNMLLEKTLGESIVKNLMLDIQLYDFNI